MVIWQRVVLALALLLPLTAAQAEQEDGYELWLRYRTLAGVALPKQIALATPGSPTVQAAVQELQRGLRAMAGKEPSLAVLSAGAQPASGAIVLATRTQLAASGGQAAVAGALEGLGDEGYLLRSMCEPNGRRYTLIAANKDIGLLYGAFAWLQAAQLGKRLDALDERNAPKLARRVLNHWDNLDRTVERGYSGESIWNWWELPDIRDQRYIDYARANASLGINGTVLNNVNSKPEILTAPWIAKAAALADVLRPYGLRVYLSVRWSTPLELKQTRTADPLDPQVAQWWRDKADEIYRVIPDFGGFLVKANSEGQPGPQDYHRTHAEGANMLAAALAPHKGIVMWRAFVYASEQPDDRAKQAYSDFAPLDGKFAPNVVVQVKNGPLDFQPREPVHPLFGAMPKTPLMMEFQVTKEYLGFATHLAYLGTLYEETLRNAAPAVAGMAGVANIGSSRTWSGSHFDQANWYAFGRLAWNPQARARDIALEWAGRTFSAKAAPDIAGLMMMSREAVVDYMTPLGLTHLMGTGHHYGPAPWVSDLARPEWNPAYYHRAHSKGIGFDRTATGSNALAQYAPALAQRWSDPRNTPPEYLLWFHHLPWDYAMPSGRTLWAELLAHYDSGVAAVAEMQQRWQRLKPLIDARRHQEVAQRLAVQRQEAQWWRDASIAYFQSVSKLPLPAGVQAPPHSLEYYKSLHFPFAPGHG
ncbi:alpha-glucuronidase family glycosyl hydrolase [Pseudoduganella sp. R-31]|uniref:alpha-glucuronidase family glycosyl hydrolase n=1 Tax=Pseudoduganella sp. R-31 TaxID=3404060 RepID=UPI003CF4E635